ncbi:MAG: CBASS cGAMP-activated phospholipase [Cyanobacteria bacterium P01_F01_bin.150]
MKSFKILSIDGGGIKGLYSAKILHLFENDLRDSFGSDVSIVDFFDLVCGTSTGELIALAIALRIPLENICEFHKSRGPKIFQGSNGFWALCKQTFLGGKFSDSYLRKSLREILGNSVIGDSHCLLCIPSYDFTHGTSGVFKYDHKEGNLTRHNRLPMLDVALATSAAPTYFPLAQIPLENNTQYVDGGVWANNPSLVGFIEAITYFVGEDRDYDNLQLFSIPTIDSASGNIPLLKRHRSFIQWAPDLFELSLIGQSEFADYFLSAATRRRCFPMSYYRLPKPEINRNQAKLLRLDFAMPQAFALMEQIATDVYYRCRKVQFVKDIFSSQKTYFIR